MINGVSSDLSLLHSGSDTNAAFGAVSGRVVVVIQGEAAGIGDTPGVGNGVGVIVVAAHPAGRVGGVTPSKFWLKAGQAVGDGDGLGVADALGDGDGDGVALGDALGDGDGVGDALCDGVGLGVGVPHPAGTYVTLNPVVTLPAVLQANWSNVPPAPLVLWIPIVALLPPWVTDP